MPRPPGASSKKAGAQSAAPAKSTRDNARSLKPEAMVDEKPQMAASEIEEELLAELQKLPDAS